MPFNFDKQLYTIKPIDETIQSDFNKNIIKALNFNPKKDKEDDDNLELVPIN